MYGLLNSCGLPVMPTCVTMPVNHVEQCIQMQRTYQPVAREIHVTVPVNRQVRSLVPVTRAINGTKNVTTNITVTRQVPEQVCKN